MEYIILIAVSCTQEIMLIAPSDIQQSILGDLAETLLEYVC